MTTTGYKSKFELTKIFNSRVIMMYHFWIELAAIKQHHVVNEINPAKLNVKRWQILFWN